MSFRGGDFSTGTTGNFQPELTGSEERKCINAWVVQCAPPTVVQRQLGTRTQDHTGGHPYA